MEKDKSYIIKCPFCGQRREVKENEIYIALSDNPARDIFIYSDNGNKIHLHCEEEYYEIIKAIDEIDKEETEKIVGNFDIKSAEYENYVCKSILYQKFINELRENFKEHRNELQCNR